MTSNRQAARTADLDALSDEQFISGWRRIVGEPPAILLEDRREMIAHLVRSIPAAEDAPARNPLRRREPSSGG